MEKYNPIIKKQRKKSKLMTIIIHLKKILLFVWLPKKKQTLKLKALTWTILLQVNTKNMNAP